MNKLDFCYKKPVEYQYSSSCSEKNYQFGYIQFVYFIIATESPKLLHFIKICTFSDFFAKHY